jgi:hypothetical protein
MNNIDDAVSHFMNQTEKSTVAVIIPLFGYWNDIKNNPVNGEVLSTVLARVYSNIHHLYIIFVANPQSIQNDPGDPHSVLNILTTISAGGNVKNIPVERNASYAEYVREGMSCAINETNSQFMVVINPWIMIQEGAIDAIVDRANRAGDAKVISGYNIREQIQPEQFDRFSSATPKEEWDINMDFMAMPRFAAEIATFDSEYLTKPFLQMDLFNTMRQKGFGVITSQQIPIFPFDFPWTDYETEEMFEHDKTHFMNKWSFDPGLRYERE